MSGQDEFLFDDFDFLDEINLKLSPKSESKLFLKPLIQPESSNSAIQDQEIAYNNNIKHKNSTVDDNNKYKFGTANNNDQKSDNFNCFTSNYVENKSINFELITKKITSYNDVVIKNEQLKSNNEKLKKNLLDLDDSAMQMKSLYQSEKNKTNSLTKEIDFLHQKCNEIIKNYDNLKLELAQKEFYYEQSKAGLENDIENYRTKIMPDKIKIYDNLALKYINFGIKLHENKLLEKTEKRNIQLLIDDMKTRNSTVPKFSRLLKSNCNNNSKSCQIQTESKESQCNLLNSLTPKNFGSNIELKSQGTQYYSATTTRSTCSSAFIKHHSVGTNFPEIHSSSISIDDIMNEMLFSIPPLSPIAELIVMEIHDSEPESIEGRTSEYEPEYNNFNHEIKVHSEKAKSNNNSKQITIEESCENISEESKSNNSKEIIIEEVFENISNSTKKNDYENHSINIPESKNIPEIEFLCENEPILENDNNDFDSDSDQSVATINLSEWCGSVVDISPIKELNKNKTFIREERTPIKSKLCKKSKETIHSINSNSKDQQNSVREKSSVIYLSSSPKKLELKLCSSKQNKNPILCKNLKSQIKENDLMSKMPRDNNHKLKSTSTKITNENDTVKTKSTLNNTRLERNVQNKKNDKLFNNNYEKDIKSTKNRKETSWSSTKTTQTNEEFINLVNEQEANYPLISDLWNLLGETIFKLINRNHHNQNSNQMQLEILSERIQVLNKQIMQNKNPFSNSSNDRSISNNDNSKFGEADTRNSFDVMSPISEISSIEVQNTESQTSLDDGNKLTTLSPFNLVESIEIPLTDINEDIKFYDLCDNTNQISLSKNKNKHTDANIFEEFPKIANNSTSENITLNLKNGKKRVFRVKNEKKDTSQKRSKVRISKEKLRRSESSTSSTPSNFSIKNILNDHIEDKHIDDVKRLVETTLKRESGLQSQISAKRMKTTNCTSESVVNVVKSKENFEESNIGSISEINFESFFTENYLKAIDERLFGEDSNFKVCKIDEFETNESEEISKCLNGRTCENEEFEFEINSYTIETENFEIEKSFEKQVLEYELDSCLLENEKLKINKSFEKEAIESEIDSCMINNEEPLIGLAAECGLEVQKILNANVAKEILETTLQSIDEFETKESEEISNCLNEWTCQNEEFEFQMNNCRIETENFETDKSFEKQTLEYELDSSFLESEILKINKSLEKEAIEFEMDSCMIYNEEPMVGLAVECELEVKKMSNGNVAEENMDTRLQFNIESKNSEFLSPESPPSQSYSEKNDPIEIPLEHYHDYSPTSPETTLQTNRDCNIEPILIPARRVIKKLSRHNKNLKNTMVMKLIERINVKKQKLLKVASFQESKEESRNQSRKLTELRVILEQFVGNTNSNCHTCIAEILKHSKCSKIVCKAILELIEDTDDNIRTVSTPPAPAMPLAHQKIICLCHLITEQIISFRLCLIEMIESRLFSLKGNYPKLQLKEITNLVYFYIGLIDNSNFDSKNPARLFICKCFYYYKEMAIPMIYQIISAYPAILPHREDSSYDHSDPIITTVQCLLNSTPYNMAKKDLNHPEVFHILKLYYGYERVVPSREEVIKNFLAKVRAGKTKNLSYAFAVVCKHYGLDWTERYVINQNLLPLTNEYFNSVKLTEENDIGIVALLEILSFILKPFPSENYILVEKYQEIFAKFLFEVDRKSIQQSAICALLRTSKFGLKNCFNIICKWNPEYEVDSFVRIMLQSFFYKRSSSFWNNLLNQI